ncbi:MAG: TM1802 family CRISPR-associated protein [Candidatus Delongbacteria bacterium]|jgi:CRISPR-associated protein Csh1|nr:TM1802 family CRISPR-associated protein [Candidatus Delongbacteria bacterium]
MSLAYKLWKIGGVLTEDDIKLSIKEEPTFKDGIEPVYMNIDFSFKVDKIISIGIKKEAISKDKFFFSKKIGGTSNAFYLYPNITVLEDKPIEKITLLYNSLEYCTKYFCEDNSRKKIDSILDEIQDIRAHSKMIVCQYEIEQNKEKLLNFNGEIKEQVKIEKLIKKYEEELEEIISKRKNKVWNDLLLRALSEIVKFQKANYIIWLSIDGRTFYEDMPEVWTNWYKNPVEFDNLKDGYDIFTNEKSKIGYKTEVKVFSYDQYHDSLNFRLNENLPLSLSSARQIKFAWIYIMENLVFYYKGLEYIIIPHLLTDDNSIFKLVIERLVQAKQKTDSKKTILEKLKAEEKNLINKIEKLKKKNSEYSKEEIELRDVSQDIEIKDIGLIQELNEQVLSLEEHLNSVTLDYLFTSINRTNLSFEIKGTIEDVIPSKITDLVNQMRKNKINDLVKLGTKHIEETYLQDYFNRNELYFAVNKSSKNNENSIFTERLHLAKLFLSDTKIKRNDLLKRFEFNRLYDYDHKKRIKKGIAEWIEYSSNFIKKENNIIEFLTKLNKIQE